MALSYELTYAGIRFLLDKAQAVRLSPRQESDDRPDDLSALRRQQPLADLIDYLDKKLPFQYLQDFRGAPAPVPAQAALARGEPDNPYPDPAIHIGDWYYPVGASRYSVFRGLATSFDVREMIAESAGGELREFRMKATLAGAEEQRHSGAAAGVLSSRMHMLPPRPLAEHGREFDGLFLVTLVDERYYFAGTPFTYHVRRHTTWQNLLDHLATALGITIEAPSIQSEYTSPEQDSQLWSAGEPAAAVLDAVAANLGRAVVRKLDGTYRLLNAADCDAIITANRGQPSRLGLYAGGEIFLPADVNPRMPRGRQKAREAVVPRTVVVHFPKYDVAGDAPHLLNTRYPPARPSAWYEDAYGETYEVRVQTESGGPLVSGVTGIGEYAVVDTAKALVSGESPIVLSGATLDFDGDEVFQHGQGPLSGSALEPLNASGLRALAMRIARDHWEFQGNRALDEVYPGLLVLEPEGIHDIVWTFSARAGGAFTRVLRPPWDRSVRLFQHATPRHGLLIASGDYASGAIYGGAGIVLEGDVQSGQPVGSGTPLSGILQSGSYLSGQVFFASGAVQLPRAYTSGNLVSGIHNAPRGVGGPSVAQTVTDGLFRGTSGYLNTSGEWTSGQVVSSGGGAAYNSSGTYNSGDLFTDVTNEQGFIVVSGGPYSSGQIIGSGVLVSSGTLLSGQAIGSGLGVPCTFLTRTLLSGAAHASLGSVDYLPTQNRWRGRIGDEVILFEGTSGGLSGLAVTIAYRAVDGTLEPANGAHANASRVCLVPPNATYGVNRWDYGKAQFAHTAEWTSGGLQGVAVVPQMQSVRVLAQSGARVNNILMYSGLVGLYDTSQSGVRLSGQVIGASPNLSGWHTFELVWVVERNNYPLLSGKYYGGHLVGYSARATQTVEVAGIPLTTFLSGTNAPVYAVNWDPPEIQMVRRVAGEPDASGYYEAFVQEKDPVTGRWVDVEPVLLEDANA